MARSSLFALAAGVASALLYLLLTSGSLSAMMLAYFSQTPLFLVGLGLGLTPAAIACGVVLISLAAATDWVTTLLFLVLSAVPVLYLVRYALLSRPNPGGGVEWYPPGLLLGGLTVYALVLLGLVVIFFGGAVEEASRQYLERLAKLFGGSLSVQTDVLARFIPSAVLASAVLMAVINGALAQGALNRMGKALRPAPDWRALSLPSWLAPILAVAIAAALLPDTIGVVGANAAVIAALPFMLVGLAVLHAISKRWPARGLALGLVYVTTIILGWPAILVAGLGVVDQWLSLRRGRAA